MSTTRHEIPTHLAVEDRAIMGLPVRQVALLLAGACLAYGIWTGWDQLADMPRGMVAGLCCLALAALALVRTLGRGLADWLFVLLRYVAAPKAATWRRRDPARTGQRAESARWADLTPGRAWGGGHR